jgi:hypothetical protein
MKATEPPRLFRRLHSLRAGHGAGVALSRREQVTVVEYNGRRGWREVFYPLVSLAPD